MALGTWRTSAKESPTMMRGASSGSGSNSGYVDPSTVTVRGKGTGTVSKPITAPVIKRRRKRRR